MYCGRADGERYLVLDGLRGVAAFLVVFHHISVNWPRPLAGGFIAVDFFFVLSGFVMSQAYDERFRQGLTVRQFVHIRLRRLVPTMWAGIVVGFIYFCFRVHDVAAGLFLAAAAFAFIPLIGAQAGIYPLDGVQWSLFFELVANVLHASIFRLLGERVLAVIAFLALTTFTIGSYSVGSTAVGDTTATFVLGFPRVVFGYVTGMLLYRSRLRQSLPYLPAAVPIVALVMIIMAVSWQLAWWSEMLAVIAMPLVVLAGTRAMTAAPEFCDRLGRLSFPVYAVHLPIILACSVIFHPD